MQVSGPVASIEKFVALLAAEGVFARRVNSSGVAFHSKYIAAAAPLLRKSLQRVIPQPKPRSPRWLSSSLPQEQWDSDIGEYECSDDDPSPPPLGRSVGRPPLTESFSFCRAAKLSDAAYHVNNLLSPVRFAEALRAVPERALLVEVAPHALLQAVLRRARPAPAAAHVALVRRDAGDAARQLLAAVGRLFAAGAQPRVAQLYPRVPWPVSRGTPALASRVRWDHSVEWSVAHYGGAARSGENVIEVDLSRPEDAYIEGHNIDGRVLFPATGYLVSGPTIHRTALLRRHTSTKHTYLLTRCCNNAYDCFNSRLLVIIDGL